jgi:hypothetical protein
MSCEDSVAVLSEHSGRNRLTGDGAHRRFEVKDRRTSADGHGVPQRGWQAPHRGLAAEHDGPFELAHPRPLMPIKNAWRRSPGVRRVRAVEPASGHSRTSTKVALRGNTERARSRQCSVGTPPLSGSQTASPTETQVHVSIAGACRGALRGNGSALPRDAIWGMSIGLLRPRSERADREGTYERQPFGAAGRDASRSFGKPVSTWSPGRIGLWNSLETPRTRTLLAA